MLHGDIGPVEFSVFVGGANISNTYFYEEDSSQIRFFSKGNEIILTDSGVRYKGTGGSFCEYMFGVEKPFKDLVKKEVMNRLVMLGAFLHKDERLVFTNDISGSEVFQRLFLLGHAVKNYYFFISSDDKHEPKKRQKHILQSVGKFLKRTALIAEDNDRGLLSELVNEIKERRSTVFIFKLVHRENLEFYRTFQKLYMRDRLLTPAEESLMNGLAAKYRIDSYQQERMKIDCMYRHPENKGIVDEYRDILLDIANKETVDQSELARLHRLRTLSIRNNISVVLFDTLDDMLLKGKKVQVIGEPEYLKESRAILENLFFKTQSLKRHIIKEDIAKLIRSKHMAHSLSDMGFEGILLDIGKACDEFARKHNDFGIFEELSSIITYFDRYDNVRAFLSKIAFMEYFDIAEDSLRSLIGNKREFDELDKGLFRDIFFTELLINKYITAFGKKKIKALYGGIDKVMKGDASLKDIVRELRDISREEALYKHVRAVLKEKTLELYSMSNLKEGMSRIRSEISAELMKKGISEDIPEKLFDRVLIDLKKESYYINNILPEIIRRGDTALREDFLINSGLDRFYIEGLEKEYLGEKGFNVIFEGGELSEVGGGERI